MSKKISNFSIAVKKFLTHLHNTGIIFYMKILRAFSTNRLVTSPHYAEILREYNERLSRDGKVNGQKFLREVIRPLIPNYSQESWYYFLTRFKSATGIAQARLGVGHGISVEQESELQKNMLAMSEATRLGIMKALNIGEKALQEIVDNPHLLSSKDKIDLLFKAMKATDSRAKAKTDIRKDEREQKVFDEAFSDAAYSHE